MRRLSLFAIHVAILVCAAGLLSACQPGSKGPQSGPDAGVTANAVAGDPIEVTALDAQAAPAATAAATKPARGETAAPQAAPTDAAAGAEAGAEAADAAPAEPAPQPDLAETPVTPKSEQQVACEKKGSKWFKIGDGKFGCVRVTKDAGKRCEKESQCDGVCLARSGTCSPFKPLYGCNEILQDNGARVNLCLE
jgi:hypothetical protein